LPLEAQRLGLEAYASDLNPVAVLISKAMIEMHKMAYAIVAFRSLSKLLTSPPMTVPCPTAIRSTSSGCSKNPGGHRET